VLHQIIDVNGHDLDGP